MNNEYIYPVYSYGITMSEMPKNISFYIQFADCAIQCPKCHSKYLWESVKKETLHSIKNKIVQAHINGADMLILFGDINNKIADEHLLLLIENIYGILPITIYSGADTIDGSLGKYKDKILANINFIKLGHYDSNLGGLKSINTNQVMYKVEAGNKLKNITKELFWGD